MEELGREVFSGGSKQVIRGVKGTVDSVMLSISKEGLFRWPDERRYRQRRYCLRKPLRLRVLSAPRRAASRGQFVDSLALPGPCNSE